MSNSHNCISCQKKIRKTRIVVLKPKDKSFILVCSEACARQLLVEFCADNAGSDFSSLKIYYDRNNCTDIPIFKKFEEASFKKRRSKKKKNISKEDISDFKIDMGLEGNKILNSLIESGKKIYEKEVKKNK